LKEIDFGEFLARGRVRRNAGIWFFSKSDFEDVVDFECCFGLNSPEAIS
jgi:hypothetical protein